MMKTDLENKDYKVNGETVRTDLEVTPQKKPLSRAQALFYRAFRDAKGHKSKMETIWGCIISFCLL